MFLTTRTHKSPATPGTGRPAIIAHDDDSGDVPLLVDTLTRQRRAVRTLVAMPAYNEEASIAKTIVGARRHADAVLVVDDGSEDETVAIAEALRAIVVCHETNRGYGGALQTIFSTARELGAEELVIIDADGQHDPAEIPRLLAELRRGNDVVIGPASEASVPCGTTTPDAAETGSLNGLSAYGRKAIEAIAISGEAMSADPAALAETHGLKVAGNRSETASSEEPRYRGKRIAVVVPAYNEERLIGETLDGIPDYVARIYVVNDASTDRTQAIIDEYARHDPRIVPIHHDRNGGVGAAIVSGYRRSLDDGFDIAAVMAGDNQMDPAFLPDLLDPIVDGHADYTMGNRLISPEYRRGMSKWRFFGNAMLTLLTKIASGYWQMMDPQNGYTAISKRALKTIPLGGIYPGYGYCNDLLVRLNVYGFRVRNIPHPARYGRETSGIRYRTYIVRVSNLLFRDFLWRLKMKYVVMGFHPLVFYYFFGVLFTLLGGLTGLYAPHYKFIQGNGLFVLAVVALLVFGLGAQFTLFAMLFDMQAERDGGWY